MNQAEFNQEREVAEERADFSAARGINWAVVSLTIFIITIVIAGLLFTLIPSNALNRNNQNTSSGVPTGGK